MPDQGSNAAGVNTATPIPSELVERMIALVRALDSVPRDTVLGRSGYASEARFIAAELPAPVDPDESLIGETAKAIYETYGYGYPWDDAFTARHHHHYTRKAAEAAIKRIRELASQEATR